MVRVLLACGDKMFCESLRGFLEGENDFAVCCETTNDVDAIIKVMKYSPDLIVVEIGSTNDDLYIAGALKIAQPQTPVFLVTDSTDVVRRERSFVPGRRCGVRQKAGFLSLLLNARAVCGLE